MKSSRPSNKLAILADRSNMLRLARLFFHERGLLEVDCPLITSAASIDAHIDLIPVNISQNETRYLHTSPEYCMKRLLVEGIGDIYQLGHVFRQGEFSPKHNPEFTMAEWYRKGFTFNEMIEETADFIRLFLGNLPLEKISYRQALLKYTGIDYVHASQADLLNYLQKMNLIPYPGIEEEGKDAILILILGSFVEPLLGKNGLEALTHYPSTQAALAQTVNLGDEAAAERFEIYYQGVELCNGYHELANAKEQRLRLEEANACRVKLGKDSLPVDEQFLSALEKGLPNTCGVAVGFDRLIMLRHHTTLSHVLTFDWTTS